MRIKPINEITLTDDTGDYTEYVIPMYIGRSVVRLGAYNRVEAIKFLREWWHGTHGAHIGLQAAKNICEFLRDNPASVAMQLRF